MKPKQPWLVTGAAGFLGSHVVEQLLAAGTPVVGVDNLFSGNPKFLEPFHSNPAFTFAKLDIREAEQLTQLMKKHRPEAVIHLAALHFIPAAVADPALTVGLNVHGTQCVLSAARAAQVSRVFLASTGDVYAPSKEPHSEDSRVAPFNIYGLTKLMDEQLVALESRAAPQTCFFIGRLFNLYGPRETNPHILPEILEQLRREPARPLRLGNLWPKRDMVPIEDAARALIEATSRVPAGVTTANIATGTPVSMQEMIEVLGELRRNPIQVETDPAKLRPVERDHLQADVSRLRSLIGWAPHSDVRKGLANLLKTVE